MAFSASNTYASVNELKLRVTRLGYVWASDVDDGDGFTHDGSPEAQYPTEALEYANVLMDEALTPHVSVIPRPANEWCKGRVVDIAAERLWSLGGRGVPAPIKLAADDAREKLFDVREGTLRVPGLDYSQTLNNGRRGGLPVRMLNVNGCGKGCRR